MADQSVLMECRRCQRPFSVASEKSPIPEHDQPAGTRCQGSHESGFRYSYAGLPVTLEQPEEPIG